MKYNELKDFVKAARETATDETALAWLELYPKWAENIGKTITNEDIEKGLNRYQHNGKLFKVVQATVFQEQYEPGAEGTSSIFVEISLEECPEWVQPTGAHDAYAKDAKVKHNGKKWVSTYDGANVWEPGVYGWDEYVQP